MGHIPFLDELALIAGLGVVVTLILARLRLPTVAGLLLVGALVGPQGLGLVRSTGSIEILAELGVVLLLFTIGLEFSLARLRHIFRSVALGGLTQVLLTTAVTLAVSVFFHQPVGRSVLYGFVFAMSSTAIVLRFLAERCELDAPHGRFIVGTLIFQDLCVVPMVLIVPLLGSASSGGDVLYAVALALGKAVVVVVATVAIARLLVPRVLSWVDASRSREIFLLAVLALCIGTAWLTSLVGLSLALGAFLGGMVVADTEYSHRAMGEMLPLRDAFVSLFFVSLGMLFDVRVPLAHPLTVALLLIGFLVGKGVLATLAALLMRFPARVAWLAGVGLAQFGEFGFVLVKLGEGAGVIDAESSRQLLAAGILSMFLTPALVGIAPHITAGERLLAPLARRLGARSIDEADAEAQQNHRAVKEHVVIVGYGVAGRLVAGALRRAELPYIVLELNAEVVRQARAGGEPVYYADATSLEALGHAHLSEARALVLLMNDPSAAQRVTDSARRIAPGVPILTRARYLGERDYLLRIGATDVVAEEVEGGVEMLARLLRRLAVP
ncbi:MAG TPA: cation:proton antiporter, partial [Pseudomonadota bacterium]|nr:cation:proton antiporter [Pseudomonadota bacterium]